jgi:hypothetical protein
VPVRHLLACLLAGALALTACSHLVGGHARAGQRDVDPGYFFAGAVPLYGQNVGADDTVVLAYLRALRRIDVCGLVDRDAMSKIGEINSVGTLYAFDECDLDLKVSGVSLRRFVGVELAMDRQPSDPAAFRVGDTPVYQSAPDTCGYQIPLPLSKLPGAGQLHSRQQPLVKIGLIAEQDCGLAQRVARAVAERLTTHPLPARDALAAYPSKLAERDPCEALTAAGADIDHWDIDTQLPYECRFSIWRSGWPDARPLQVHLQPEVVDAATEGLERREQDGVEIFVDRTFCSALSFVGPPMLRRLAGGGYAQIANLVIRPAVVVDFGGDDCEEAAGLAARAAKLYG